MDLTKCKLGELITQRREKNDGSELPICGVSKDGLIPPKQVDADTSIYNVFYRDDFIFNPARMELNSIAINDKYDRAICSSLYEVFYVHRTDLLLPHYLKLIVKQKWFTRYCEFLGQGSAREYCRFNNISEIEIEFPSIEEQQKIVDYYTAHQSDAMQIEITPDKFGGNYYLEASTLFRRQADGKDLPAELIFPNVKIQSNFTFTMASSGDPSTFTFTMDAFPDYTRFDKTKKVLAAIQIINTGNAEAVSARTRTSHDPAHEKFLM